MINVMRGSQMMCRLSLRVADNGRVLGEVALCVGFERWEAILPNTCYALVAVLYQEFQSEKGFCSFLWEGKNIFNK